MRSVIVSCLAVAVALTTLPAIAPSAHAQSAHAQAPQAQATEGQATVRGIVEAYARSQVQNGLTVGVGVAVIQGTAPIRLFGYGRSVAPSASTAPRRFRHDDLFQIGSVTKVFTTYLLGQAVSEGALALDTPLSDFATQLGTLGPLTRQITLQQLADFTAGIDDYAPQCSVDPVPGCLPSGRPPVSQYTAADYAAFFRGTAPQDFSQQPPQPAASLPAPYYYSDYSVGMLGLLLASRDAPLANRDLHRWHHAVRRKILLPIGMHDTVLRVPPSKSGRIAAGYVPALARAEVANGGVSAIEMTSTGGLYTAPPAVRIVGGGGRGATAVATLGGAHVTGISVTNAGSGYLAPPTVAFKDGGSTTEAEAEVIVRNGQVAAIMVRAGGAGYSQVPTVVVSGGRLPSGRDATATAHLVNGRVGYLTLDDPGAGYVPPLAVVVAPGAATSNQIPIWAPAGALSASLRDMAKFARVALLQKKAGNHIPATLAEGFAIAEAPYACTGPDPDLSACPAGTMQSALSWAVQPADTANAVPSIVSKDGGLPGYSTYVALMPEANIAVVVMANSVSMALPPVSRLTAPAVRIANNVLYALHAACRSQAGCAR